MDRPAGGSRASVGSLPYPLGYNTNGFAHHRLEDALQILSGLGYHSVAITPDVHHLPPFETGTSELRGCRRLLDQLLLEPVVETGARYVLDPRRKHRPNLLDSEPAARAERLRFLLRCAEIAAELRAPTLSIWSGARPPETPPADADDFLAEGVDRLCRRAAELGIRVAFEPEPGMYVESLDDWDRLRDRLRIDNLGLTLDVGHVPCTEPISAGDAIRSRAGELLNVHLDDCRGGVHEHLQVGDGELDWSDIAAALLEADFAGAACFELSRHSHAAPDAAREALSRFHRLT